MLVIRELTGGLYFGKPQERRVDDGAARAPSTRSYYNEDEIERVVRTSASSSRARARTSVTQRRQGERARVVAAVARGRDRGAPRVSRTSSSSTCSSTPARCTSSAARAAFDVIVTENMFGDILTDEAVDARRLAGHAAVGVARRARGRHRLGLYEPIHGSAPDIAGQGIANPLGTILLRGDAAAPLARPERGGRRLEAAVDAVITSGLRTADIAGAANRQSRRARWPTPCWSGWGSGARQRSAHLGLWLPVLCPWNTRSVPMY